MYPEIESLQIKSTAEFTELNIDSGEFGIIRVRQGGILTTFGLGPCVGYVGFDQRRKILFGCHLYLDPRVDQELSSFIRHLHQLGITINDSAISGGRLDVFEMRRDPIGTQENQDTSQRASRLAHLNFINPRLSSIVEWDDLEVAYHPKRGFSIVHESGYSNDDTPD